MARMTDAERDRFLEKPRYGILSLLREDGFPVSVPVWFEWTGDVVRIFASATSPKIRRLAADPRASVLVANHLDEPEAWVAFDGPISTHESGGIEVAEKLAPRYWDMGDPEHQRMLAMWRDAKAALCLLEMKPARIRTYKEEFPPA